MNININKIADDKTIKIPKYPTNFNGNTEKDVILFIAKSYSFLNHHHETP
jgi:hypothetical protein